MAAPAGRPTGELDVVQGNDESDLWRHLANDAELPQVDRTTRSSILHLAVADRQTYARRPGLPANYTQHLSAFVDKRPQTKTFISSPRIFIGCGYFGRGGTIPAICLQPP